MVRKRFILVLSLTLFAAPMFIISPEPVSRQPLSWEFRAGRMKISVRFTDSRWTVSEEGWTPGVKQTGWVEWR